MERTIEYRYTIRVDEDPRSPRDCDNVATMACFHRRYELGDKKDKGDWERFLYSLAGYARGIDEVDSVPTPADMLRRAARQGYEVLPLYLYDHSGLRISTGAFSCRWDSGQVGWIYVHRDRFKAECGFRGGWRQAARKHMVLEVEDYDKYLSGDVWGYVIEKWELVNGEWVCADESWDSCWGYYGRDLCEEEAASIVNRKNNPEFLLREQANIKAERLATDDSCEFFNNQFSNNV